MEFALIASLLFLIVFGIIQFGLAYNRVQGLQAGAREGARIGSLPSSTVTNTWDRLQQTLTATLSVPPQNPSAGQPFSSPPALNNSLWWISRRPAAGGALVPITVLTDHPCDVGSGAAKGDSVVISVSNRTLIQLPPVMQFSVTITGQAQFLCEI